MRLPNTLTIVFVLVLMAVSVSAQTPGNSEGPFRVGGEVKAPRALHREEPKYSPAARDGGVQGSVAIELVIDEKGRPTEKKVISPLGFGLDENALAAVRKWKFAPGTKEGKPVPVVAIVETNFKLTATSVIDKAETQRTAFNVALAGLKRTQSVEKAVKSMQDLAKQGFPPAMHAIGTWEMNGEHVPQNSEDGLMLLRKAAEKKFGPALYEMAIRKIEGRDFAKDTAKGMEEMQEAALLGSAKAQFYLGDVHEKSDVGSLEFNQAGKYFRLCAAQGIAACQYRLGKLLFNTADREERDYVQAIALFQLAGEQGVPEAKDIASAESAKLTRAQTEWVGQLKAEIVRK
jgi:TonB family protein